MEINIDKQQHLDAFIEVLECSLQEASFFLESASWNISTAVSLYLEEQQYSKRRATDVTNISSFNHFPSITSQDFIPNFDQLPTSLHRYQPRSVIIEDLPHNWSAAVSPRSGKIVFINAVTNCRQYIVPPGFADRLPDVIIADTMPDNFSDYSNDNPPPLAMGTNENIDNHACELSEDYNRQNTTDDDI